MASLKRLKRPFSSASVHDFAVTLLNGESMSLASLKGRPAILTNVASA